MAPVTRSKTTGRPRRTYTNANANAPLGIRKQPKPPSKFHHFPRLPAELRVVIWEMALRPRRTKGVHYLTLFKSADDKESPLENLAVTDRQLDSFERKYKPHLVDIEHRAAAPNVSPDGDGVHQRQYSWFKGNRSLYAWEAGLFTACPESNRIIRKAFRPGLVHEEWLIEAQHNGETAYLRVNRGDLFCFEFQRNAIEASMSIRWTHLLAQLALGFLKLPPSHIAFEFDPSWLTSLPEEGEPLDIHYEPSPRGLVARVFDAWCHRHLASHVRIWLIDRSLPLSRQAARRRFRTLSFSDLHTEYIPLESQGVFYGRDDIERAKDTSLYFCKRLNDRKESISGAPRESCLGVLVCKPTDHEDCRGWVSWKI